MSEHHTEIIFVKRRGGHEDEHHGGAWKIAFADFMTAMMTFFLVLWIINATDKSTKSVIARYFNPVRLENPAKGHKGVHNEANVSDPDSKDSDGDASASAQEAKAEKSKSSSAANEKKRSAKAEGREPAEHPETRDAAHPKPTLSESALLADPYSSLDHIAGPAPAAEHPASAGNANEASSSEATAADSFRDPFESAADASKNMAAAKVAAEIPPRAPSSSSAKEKSVEQASQTAQSAPSSATPASHPSSSAGASTTPKEGKASAAAKKVLNELRVKIGAANPGPGPGVDVRATSEGVLISLTDQLNFSMFAVGSAEPQPEVVRAMNVVAQTLASHPGIIVIRGHTDGRPYRSQTYDNWRLSEARAQMAYYMLTRAHLSDKRIEHVEGYADRRPKNAADPYAAENRRIEILLRDGEP